MPLVKADKSALLFTESVLDLLVQSSKSKYTHINPDDTLELVFKEVILPAGHIPLGKKAWQSIGHRFRQLLDEWPKSINGANLDWFREHILIPFTTPVLQSSTVKELAKRSGAVFYSRLQLLTMQRLCKGLIQENPLDSRLKADLKLCEDWTELLNVDAIKKRMREELDEFILHNENIISRQILNDKTPGLLSMLDGVKSFVSKIRDHYLFDKLDDAEEMLKSSIQRLRSNISNFSFYAKDPMLHFVVAHLDLSEEQQAIQRGFIQIIENLSIRERVSVFSFFKAIVHKEFQYQGKGLDELNLKVFERIQLWEPKTSERGIQRFKELFIDYYTAPVLQVIDYYKIDSRRIRPEDQTDFVRSLLRLNIDRKVIKRDQKIQCLFTWLHWYPKQPIHAKQTRVTWGIINDSWGQFERSIDETGSYDGFSSLWRSLASNPVFQFDYEAAYHFYTLVQQQIKADESGRLRAFLELNHPEFLYDAPQFWLFISSQHLLILIQEQIKDSDHLLKNLLSGNLGRVFFDFPVCKTHDNSHCMDELFSHHSLIESFSEKLEAWEPQTDEASLEAFIQEFIMYYSAPFFSNPIWKNYWNKATGNDIAEQCEKYLQAALVYKILTTWSKYHPDEAISLVNKIQCLQIWINNYPVDSIAQAQNSVIQRMIDNALKDFTTALQGGTGKLSIKKPEEVGPAFQHVLADIRDLFVFKQSLEGEFILHNKIKDYLDTLKESKVESKFIDKVRDAILADNRFSLNEEQMLKISFKHPWKAIQLLSTKSDEAKRELVRRQSEDALKADIEKAEKKHSPALTRKADVADEDDEIKHLSSRSNSPVTPVSKPEPKKTSPHISRSVFTKRTRERENDSRLDSSKKSNSFPY